MQTYIALLRGINVGGRIIKMAELKACLERMGLAEVTTILQSGNVLFDSSETSAANLRNRIESEVSQRFGYRAVIFVYPQEFVASTFANYPFDRTDVGWQHYVLFFDNGLEKQLMHEAHFLDGSMEAITAGDGVMYWQVQKGMTLKSDLAKLLNKKPFKDAHTNRNVNTLQKLVAAK